MPDAPADEHDLPKVDDWLNEAADYRPRSTWAQTIDRRKVTVGASAIVMLIAVLAAAGVFSGSAGNGRPTVSTPISTASNGAGPTRAASPPPLPAPATTLKLGDSGAQVSVLQRALASLGFSPGKTDGQYGPATSSAVARFQRSVALVADGVLGPVTLRALESALRGP